MISYAWADKDIVRPLVDKLEHMNVRVWIDVNNMGSDINEAMIDGICRSAVVIAFLSDSYIASHNCNLEIKFANDIHKPIIPVRLASTEEVVFSAAAFVTAGQLYIDLTKGVGANSHEAIATRIFKLIVGEGSFGMVRKGLYLESIPVAVKTLKLLKLSEKSKLELINEANILQKSRHPFIIGFHGVVNVDDNFSLVLEFASLGSLHDYYLNPDNEYTPLKQRLTFLIQVSAGMSYLHGTLKIMHNDLKSLNILLTKTFQDGSIVSKITDFGLSKIKTETMTRSTSSAAAGSILWLAPELKSVRPKVSSANDVYSFAVLMTEVLSWTGAYGIPWEDTEINLQGFIDALRVPEQRDDLLQRLQLELKALHELVQEEPDVAEAAEG
ncbi:kinase-like domain-containing protein [Zopfochytrium polystomum]|nr:kinase-like domain-containing protein [Zopfochytrium polystomum]